MTTRRKDTPYRIPSAWQGDKLKQYFLIWDTALMEAAQEIAKEETERWGARVSAAVLLTNILLHDKNPHFKQLKVELRRRYNLTKTKEKHQREQAYKEELEAAGLKEPSLPIADTSGVPGSSLRG